MSEYRGGSVEPGPSHDRQLDPDDILLASEALPVLTLTEISRLLHLDLARLMREYHDHHGAVLLPVPRLWRMRCELWRWQYVTGEDDVCAASEDFMLMQVMKQIRNERDNERSDEDE